MNNKLNGKYESRKLACFLMISSSFFFASMQIFIAKTSQTIPIFEQVFFRNVIAMGIAFLFLKKGRIKFSGNKKNIKLLVFRAIAGYLGMVTLFYATGNGTQGDVATLFRLSPFITVLLAAIFLKEKIKKIHVVALIIAFAGVIFVSGPNLTSDLMPILAAIASAIFGGIAYTLISSLKGKEHPWLIIFVFSSLSTLFTIPLMIMDFVIPTYIELIFLLMIGLLAAAGQICLTYSYAFAPASDVSIYNYSGIIFSIVLAYIFLEQILSITSYIGASLVILAGFLMYFVGIKKKKRYVEDGL